MLKTVFLFSHKVFPQGRRRLREAKPEVAPAFRRSNNLRAALDHSFDGQLSPQGHCPLGLLREFAQGRSQTRIQRRILVSEDA